MEALCHSVLSLVLLYFLVMYSSQRVDFLSPIEFLVLCGKTVHNDRHRHAEYEDTNQGCKSTKHFSWIFGNKTSNYSN